MEKESKTVTDLQKAMYDHEDVGLALQVQNAIKAALNKKKFVEESKLSLHVLGEIRSELYEGGKSPDTLFHALMGGSKNPTEAALQYIENLMRKL